MQELNDIQEMELKDLETKEQDNNLKDRNEQIVDDILNEFNEDDNNNQPNDSQERDKKIDEIVNNIFHNENQVQKEEVINEKNNEDDINPENNNEQKLHKDANLENDNKEIIDNNIKEVIEDQNNEVNIDDNEIKAVDDGANNQNELEQPDNKEIEEAKTEAVSRNNSLDEAPIPDQEDINVNVNQNENLILGVNDISFNEEENKFPEKPQEPEDNKESKKEEVQKEEPKPLTPMEESLNEVSKGSGLKLKAYFIEDNKKEMEALKNNPNIRNFQFNGDLKSFYKDAYRYILESNMIARQLNPDKKLPDITKLTEKFEAFMQNVGQELKERNQIEEYVPFGGLSAHEIKEIQKDILMNRPKTMEEALQRNASRLGGKDYDAKIDNAYIQAHQTIDANFGPNYKVGDNPKLDDAKLTATINTIKGAKLIHENKKIWETYKPDFSAPKFNKPIWKHPISNTFKLIGRGIGIVWDCAVKFPVNNALRGLTYPLKKGASIINRMYNERKLENELLAKGFTKDQIQEKMNENNTKTLDIEKDSKNIEKQFEKNRKIVNEYKESKEKDKQKTVEKTNVKDVEVVKNDNIEINPNKQTIVVKECETQIYEGDLVQPIEDNSLQKVNDLKK